MWIHVDSEKLINWFKIKNDKFPDYLLDNYFFNNFSLCKINFSDTEYGWCLSDFSCIMKFWINQNFTCEYSCYTSLSFSKFWFNLIKLLFFLLFLQFKNLLTHYYICADICRFTARSTATRRDSCTPISTNLSNASPPVGTNETSREYHSDAVKFA